MKLISKEYIEKHLPPNADAEHIHALICLLLFLGAAGGFIGFLCNYGLFYNNLFYYRDGHKLLRAGMMMGTFSQVTRFMCICSAAELFFALLYPIQLYTSFFGKSQSIYLMRRLPDNRRTLRHMIVDVPLRWALCALVLGLVSLGIAYLIWRFCTPAVCLPL